MMKSNWGKPWGTTLVFLSVLILLALVLPQTLFWFFLLAYLVVVFRGEDGLFRWAAVAISSQRESDPARSPPW